MSLVNVKFKSAAVSAKSSSAVGFCEDVNINRKGISVSTNSTTTITNTMNTYVVICALGSDTVIPSHVTYVLVLPAKMGIRYHVPPAQSADCGEVQAWGAYHMYLLHACGRIGHWRSSVGVME